MAAALEQYLPRLVREWDEQAPGASYRSIPGSMVFVDVSGFTKMSERLARHGKVGAEEVTEVIGNTFERLLAEAYAYGASLLKFGGDALLLFFQGSGHHLRACAAAQGMREALRQVGRFTTTAGLVQLRMSVGVHAGTFDFFLVGASHRELIVAGYCATETTNMESAASAGQILISPDTAGLLPARNRGRAIGPGILLAGRIDGAELYEIEPARRKQDLEQFIPTSLRPSLLSGEVEPEHRAAAVGFIHFMGFDQLIGESSDRATKALDELVQAVQQAADARGVSFLASDIAGDGGKIILTAGVPISTGNDEEQMLLALRDVVGAGLELPLQIGVNWGPVFAGEIGPSYRRTYTVMGDTVNLAARLMAKAGSGEIFAVGEALEGSRTLFQTKELEPFLVKGKKHPIQAFSVGAPIGSRAAISSSALPLVGRDHELESMTTAWRSAIAGSGRIVQLTADPGMGKSRLLEEFMARAEGGKRAVRTECRLYQSATPYFPFRALLRSAWDLDLMGDREAVESLRSMVAGTDLEPWLSLIGTAVGLEVEPSAEVTMLEDQFRPARTRFAVSALLSRTIDTPTIFVIEDTHWMDEASNELLTGLMADLGSHPWLVIATRRPGDEGFVVEDSETAVKVELKPLSQEQVESLIATATHDNPLLPQQVRNLAVRVNGHPLFLVELLQALRQGNDVEHLPHSVEGLIGSRIDQLPPKDRNILRRVAVLGNGFQAEYAGAVLAGADAGSPLRAFRRLGDFVSVNQKGWVQFKHALIRDVAYQGLPFRTRQSLHMDVAESIRRAAGDDPESQAALLSLHYFNARQWGDAWRFSRVAGNDAKGAYANADAALFFERGLEAAKHSSSVGDEDRVAVLTSLGDVRLASGEFDDALAAFVRATKLERDPIGQARLQLRRARVRERSGNYTQALREIGHGYKGITEEDSKDAAAARAQLNAFAAVIEMARERFPQAIERAWVAVRQSREAGDDLALAESYSALDTSYRWAGEPEKATYAGQALELFERLGDLQGTARVTTNLGGAAYFEGRWKDAVKFYEESREAYLKAGNEVEAAYTSAGIGELLVGQGRPAEAEVVLDEALRTLRAAGFADGAAFAEVQLARVRLAQGELEPALVLFDHALATFEEFGENAQAVDASVHKAEGLVEAGRCEEALVVVEAADAKAGDDRSVYGPALDRARGRALAGLGRYEEAGSAISTGLAEAERQGLQYDVTRLVMAGIELDRRQGLVPDSADLARARELMKGLGMVVPEALLN
ncbi:MAG TPA: adenylate/guanylate cyclase domain-containing protein [Acidimicrobiia bacterium]